jgi:hypothetical protein
MCSFRNFLFTLDKMRHTNSFTVLSSHRLSIPDCRDDSEPLQLPTGCSVDHVHDELLLRPQSRVLRLRIRPFLVLDVLQNRLLSTKYIQ